MSAIEAIPEIVSRLPSTADPELRAELLFALERRRPQLLRLAVSITRHPDDAEDILQESVLKALRFLPRFRGDARIDTWLHAIVANTARDWARSRRDHPHMPLESEPGEGGDTLTLDFPQACEDPEESCSRHEMLRLLRAEIRALDPRYQLPIRLCDLDGRTYREAARILRVSGPAIKAKLFRGRVLLRRRLARHLRIENDLSQPPRRGKSRPAAASPPRPCLRGQPSRSTAPPPLSALVSAGSSLPAPSPAAAAAPWPRPAGPRPCAPSATASPTARTPRNPASACSSIPSAPASAG